MPLPPEQIRSTFALLSSSIILLAFAGIFLSYFFLLPNISSLFLAFLWALLLGDAHKRTVEWFERTDTYLSEYLRRMLGKSNYKVRFGIGLLLTSLAISMAFLGPLISLLASVLFTYLVFIIVQMDRKALASLCISALFFLAIVVVLSALAGSIYWEGRVARDNILAYLDNNNEFQTLINDYKNSHIYIFLRDWAGKLEIIDVSSNSSDNLVDFLKQNVNWIWGKYDVFVLSVKTVFSKSYEIFYAILLFFPSFFYFLQYNDKISRAFVVISPFSEEESVALFRGIVQYILRIWTSSLIIGVVHGLVTGLTFYLLGFELIFIFALLSGLMSTVPIVSSWVIWVPACVYLLLRNEVMKVIFMASSHLLANMFLDTWIFQLVPDSHPYVISVSVVTGLYAFGIMGFFIGPLIVCISVQLYQLFKSYMCGFEEVKRRWSSRHSSGLIGDVISRSHSSASISLDDDQPTPLGELTSLFHINEESLLEKNSPPDETGPESCTNQSSTHEETLEDTDAPSTFSLNTSLSSEHR